ncbi:Axin-1 [Wickerhamomyces ciferrii]|uniref:Axin-1 n=1 Tax=Wickerhamomyces ciferrii (strain ATCC 14091 / BCRC 22168 / CBS 111 / JCM 3599 / NBRC 0793 / NRRL Y-1031 F-60-10) TaxID=1206466 RepID=K0KQ45_WICCF|nr:Axin-1 [Wickerhamomyces ciferrii]CCH43554.1 Axin-1 [Wickerhamomyces ciferrii]
MTQIDISTQSFNTTDNNHNIITPISPEPKNLQLHHQPKSPSVCSTFELLPSYEEVLSGNSPAPYSRVAFANFLKKIHSLENLEFLIQSNNYLLSEFEKEKSLIWDHLYINFISNDSPKEVNIPFEYKDEFFKYFQIGELPSNELISNTMIIIKDLLRDAFFQFLNSTKKTINLNENYKFISNNSSLPTPTYDEGVEEFSPLENTSRSGSPLSYTDETTNTNSTTNSSTNFSKPPRSSTSFAIKSSDSLNSSCEFVIDSKKSSISSNKSVSSASGGLTSNKNSISEVSKKIAGKLKWRRSSTNSSG